MVVGGTVVVVVAGTVVVVVVGCVVVVVVGCVVVVVVPVGLAPQLNEMDEADWLVTVRGALWLQV